MTIIHMQQPTRTLLPYTTLFRSSSATDGQRRRIIGLSDLDPAVHDRRPWNVGTVVGAKRPLKPRDVWAIRFFLDERSEEHTSELQSRENLVCRLLLEKKTNTKPS